MIAAFKILRILLIAYLMVQLSLNVTFINIPSCVGQPHPTIFPFTYTTNGTIDNTTSAHMCHDQQYLHIYWFNFDQQIISTLNKCNDPLYTQDAVQIFIATNDSYPKKYFEFEVSPSGQLFFADILNPNANCSSLGTEYYPCSSATYTSRIHDKGWDAYLKIDLIIIGRGKRLNLYKGNIYRIDKSKNKPTRYLSFSPTMSSPACFHQPLKFIEFRLV